MFGAELQSMTKNLAESRNGAMARLMNEARNKGGNAIIRMRFDTTELGDVWTEICAYGTAVQAVPVTDAQSPRLFFARLVPHIADFNVGFDTVSDAYPFVDH